ncbi:chymotrypsin inhibitor-like [Xylocopa sonorina]|uniref:chymotrypsin inhibitor-like n=1 Tax=Xylocopa sonorina TaxID=1818115 RepID=UPI00403AE313
MSRFTILVMMVAAMIVVFETEGRVRVPPPLDCSANETWSLCGLACEPSCAEPMKGQMCLGCVRGDSVCRCADDYVRDPKTGGCVKLEDC